LPAAISAASSHKFLQGKRSWAQRMLSAPGIRSHVARHLPRPFGYRL